jgi:hypothetical protein
MPEGTAAYLLLGLDVVVVGAVLSAPVLLLWWVVGRTGRSTGGGGRVLRRCNACGAAWKGRPGQDVRLLRLRRRTRRRSRDRKKDAPAWAARQGWSRCPSCLSRDVRPSSRDATAAGAPPERH